MEQSSPEILIENLLGDPRLQFLPKEDLGSKILQLSAYARLWEKWNGKISLTAEKEMALYIRKHFFVSLQFLKALGNSRGIADIGSGSGLPGIPLKILLPKNPLLLVECRRKRANFLKQVARQLNLENTVVFDSKVEDIKSLPFPVEAALFRAVADTRICLEMASGILQSGGQAILIRTPDETCKESPHPEYSQTNIVEVEDVDSNPLFLECYKKC